MSTKIIEPIMNALMIICFSFVSLSASAATLEPKSCATTTGKRLEEIAFKLKLAEQGYRIISVTYDESTRCYHLYGFSPTRIRIAARFDPYSGHLVYEERVKKLEIK